MYKSIDGRWRLPTVIAITAPVVRKSNGCLHALQMMVFIVIAGAACG